MALVESRTRVYVDGEPSGEWAVSTEHKDTCQAIKNLRGEARDGASTAIDLALEKFGCPKEERREPENFDLDRGGLTLEQRVEALENARRIG